MWRSTWPNLLFIAFVSATSSVAAQSINSQISSACANGGGVVLPATITVTSTIQLTCPNGSRRVSLKGAPTTITCSTGSSACIEVGSANEYVSFRPQLTLEDVSLIGPGRSIAGSEAIRVLPSADQAIIRNIRIDEFDKGIHFVGATGLLFGTYVSDAVVGFGSTNSGAAMSTVNMAVHLDGEVANIEFTRFQFSAQQRVILSDGIGGSGAGASFTSGSFNTTNTPGMASIFVDSADGAVHELSLSDIQDWETACPFLDVGRNARVHINQVSFNGDVQASGNLPGYRMLPNTVSWLRISNSNIGHCSGSNIAISVESQSSFIAVSSTDIVGTVYFGAKAGGTFVGNRCNISPGLYGGINNSNLAYVRASANIGFCGDR